MATSERHKIFEWVRVAEERGWTVRQTKVGSHLKFFRPDGSYATSVPGTPGGGNRSIDNARAKLRRAGLAGIR